MAGLASVETPAECRCFPEPHTHALQRVVLAVWERPVLRHDVALDPTIEMNQLPCDEFVVRSCGSAQATGGPLEPSVPGSPRSTGTTMSGTRPALTRAASGSSAADAPADAPPLKDRQMRQSTWL